MIIQNKPDYLIFADSAKKGENAEFPDVRRGWGVTIDQTASKPPMEWMNGAFNRIDKNMLYLLQQGVPEWSEQVTYPANAIIKYNGVLYTAIVENDNAIPTTSTTKWKKTQEEIPNASLFQKGVVKLNSEINSESETEAATPKAIKKVCDLANNQVPNIRKINNKTLNTDIVLQADDVNALPAIRKFDNNIPVYEVGNDTNHIGKLTVNDELVLTKADLQNPVAYIVETFVSYDGWSWYRKYSDGWIEQGGAVLQGGHSIIVNLLVPFSKDNYTITNCGGYSYSNADNIILATYNSYFIAHYKTRGVPFRYYACGY